MAESVHQRIATGRRALRQAGFSAENAALDAEVLARHVLGWDRARLLVRRLEPAPPDFAERFDDVIARRARREPVALIVGRREFWGLDFIVTPATLVPRPESELIVEEALRWIPAGTDHAMVLDIGTGTGCLAIAIACERSGALVVATDLSADALLVARANARVHGVDRQVRFVRTDLLGGLAMAANVMVCNPPYVPESASTALAPDVMRFEPGTALFGGTDGLAVMRRLLATAADSLAPDGRLIVEFGYGQEDCVRDLALAEGWRIERILRDLQGLARTIVLRR
jgi:release factor glutamine methyltransferase